MRKFLAGLMVFVSLIQAQTPIIRVMQSREYKTPKTWWREPLTFNLRGYLADDTTGMSTATNASGVALYNNNFDAWRDSVMTLAITLQDDGAFVNRAVVLIRTLFSSGHMNSSKKYGLTIEQKFCSLECS